MDKAAAARLVKDTFENPFDKAKFSQFTSELLNGYEPITKRPISGSYIKDAFKGSIKSYERIGKYTDSENNEVDILIVYLCRESSMAYARTMQRNFIAWYLNGGRGDIQRDAALVAVVSPNPEDWRFSLVKMDYKLETTPSGQVKGKEEFTPARRYSFLVGANERSHTAQQSLVPLLVQESKKPNLSDLEQAFNIERVTKEFFEKYKELFLRVKESLDQFVGKDSAIKEDFDQKGVETADFAKKLLGQIVFLYFLQKKGWFGVAREDNWGEGPKGFIRSLFEKKVAPYNNFFNDILEPMFYEALATERTGNFYSRFNCKIPFLNGGLFDPINGYDWENTDINLSDKLFSNDNKTSEGDIGDGILDVFDRYNFTVCEDEPLEKEVAVDPEMLGKVFENLLEVKDRKSKGAFYTPREIVHYMCQESLINYLYTQVPDAVKEDIELFIRKGDTEVVNVKTDGDLIYKLPGTTASYAGELDKALHEVRVCDPAVGSGAFLVGMMNEVVRARLILGRHLSKKRSPYGLKRHAIQNCLYGVDIDPGAVEIAKLRLWLSLVVDEEDIKQIKPLPNLDYKIMQGNSLLEEYEGIKLFDDSLLGGGEDITKAQIQELKQKQSKLQQEYFDIKLSDEPDKVLMAKLEEEIKEANTAIRKLNGPQENGPQKDLWAEAGKAHEKAEKLKKFHKEFFDESRASKKKEIKEQIDALEWELIETTLREQKKESALDEVQQMKAANVKPFFLWKLNFSEVFQEKGGFNVVIANPPYVDSEEMTKSMPEQREQIAACYATAKGNWDLYIPFWELGFNLLHPFGNSVFITPNKWLGIKYGEKLRELLRPYVYHIGNCDQVKVFEAGNSPVLVFVDRSGSHTTVDVDAFDTEYCFSELASVPKSMLSGDNWGFLLSRHIDLLLRIAESPRRVKDDYYAENPFTVSEAYDLKPILLDLQDKDEYTPRDYFRFVNTGTIDRYKTLWGTKLTTYIKSKYRYPVVSRESFCKEFPKRYEQMNACKIVISGMRHFECLLDADGSIIAGKSTVILKRRKSGGYTTILGILNSKLVTFYLKESYGVLGIDGGINFTADVVEAIPIPNLETAKLRVDVMANSIQEMTDAERTGTLDKKSGLADCERQLDNIVYELYELTPDEIALVEESVK